VPKLPPRKPKTPALKTKTPALKTECPKCGGRIQKCPSCGTGSFMGNNPFDGNKPDCTLRTCNGRKGRHLVCSRCNTPV
jgi:hypothetical protein